MPTDSSKKHPHTKRLVRLAIEHGYTNADIAKAAGLSGKSIAQVSRWRNGEALATERQMAKLEKEFGHLLKRQISHLFYTNRKNEDGTEQQSFYHISGERIFSHKIVNRDEHRGRPFTISLFRVVIIKTGKTYTLILQCRKGMTLDGEPATFRFPGTSEVVHSSIEESIWNVAYSSNHEYVEELASKIDALADMIHHGHLCYGVEKSEGATLKFAFRHCFIKLGIKLEDLEPLPEVQLSKSIC